MFAARFDARWLLLLALVTLVTVLPALAEGDSEDFPVSAPPTRAAVDLSKLPPAFVTGDGHSISIQREWASEQDPIEFENVPLGEQPFRFDQRQPLHVYTEPRAGKQPLYYFNDVRWTQEDRPEGRKFGRRAYFTSAVVDLEKVKGAYFCMKPFAPKFLAGHAAVLLEFEPGGFRNLDGEESEGFVISYEAYLRVTQQYELIGGQFGRKFRIIYVVGTWRDFLIRSIRFGDSVVKRWKLDLTKDQLKTLALEIGKVVLADHSAEHYNTTRASCITAALRLLNVLLPERERSPERWLGGLIANPGWALPVFADNILRHHRLITGDKETITAIPPAK